MAASLFAFHCPLRTNSPLTFVTLLLLCLLVVYLMMSSPYNLSSYVTSVSKEQRLQSASAPTSPNTTNVMYYKDNGGVSVFPYNNPYIISDYLNKSHIKILMWTPVFQRNLSPDVIGRSLFEDLRCPESRCELVDDHAGLDDAEVIVFHLSDLDIAKLPQHRHRWQKWTFYTMESPPKLYLDLSGIRNVFNTTMTYRTDSDIPSPYGRFFPDKSDASRELGGHVTGPGRRLVAWLVSNSYTASLREGYVQELSKHIPVDIYGHSQDVIPCPDNCTNFIGTNYKFYLAFENSICVDYITEKAFRSYSMGVVPVILGHPDNKHVLPPGAYIDVHDFTSPKQLADYLKLLDTNDTLYNTYFNWKRTHRLRETVTHVGYLIGRSACEMCQYFHKTRAVAQIYHDIHSWWRRDKCLSPDVYYKSVAANIKSYPKTPAYWLVRMKSWLFS